MLGPGATEVTKTQLLLKASHSLQVNVHQEKKHRLQISNPGSSLYHSQGDLVRKVV